MAPPSISSRRAEFPQVKRKGRCLRHWTSLNEEFPAGSGGENPPRSESGSEPGAQLSPDRIRLPPADKLPTGGSPDMITSPRQSQKAALWSMNFSLLADGRYSLSIIRQ